MKHTSFSSIIIYKHAIAICVPEVALNLLHKGTQKVEMFLVHHKASPCCLSGLCVCVHFCVVTSLEGYSAGLFAPAVHNVMLGLVKTSKCLNNFRQIEH